MINANFEYITSLQYRVKALKDRVNALESGEKYTSMLADFNTRLDRKDREIRRLKAELADANRQLAAMKKNWSEVFEDVEREHAKELAKKDREIKDIQERLFRTEQQRDDALQKAQEKMRELYQVKTELEEEQGKNQKLTAQINRDYENSSTPSSMKPAHKKIANNREKTGKKPGGQPGHEGHSRRKHTPSVSVPIPAPEKYTDSYEYKPTGKTITKQMVDLRIQLFVTEYSTPEYRHLLTGQRVHAEFPKGLINEVNYSGNVKALAFLLNNHCNVSIAKVSDHIAELTGGELKLSTGMINSLARSFSQKTQKEQKKAFVDILLSPVMNTDFTSARVNGQNVNVAVCATKETVVYSAREHKGHEGVKGTPVEDYQGILVHDHDKTFYHYGQGHQECLDHIARYLKDSIANEPDRTWNLQMRDLIREMIHFRNSLDMEKPRSLNQMELDQIQKFHTRYDEILLLAQTEYEYVPPSKYYWEGFKLFKRMLQYRDNHLLFLHNLLVPHTNNLSERLLRIFKRKQKQVMTFRSFSSLEDLCHSLGTIASLRAHGQNLFQNCASIFER